MSLIWSQYSGYLNMIFTSSGHEQVDKDKKVGQNCHSLTRTEKNVLELFRYFKVLQTQSVE